MAKTGNKETIVDKTDLFHHLDGYIFSGEDEITQAICDFIEDQEGELYYSDIALAGILAEEYMQKDQI